MKTFKRISALVLTAALAIGVAGCGGQSSTASSTTQTAATTATTTAPAQLKKVKVGYFGNTCEAPSYAAFEQGFFKEEGLDVELVKGDANTLKDALATNKIDATDGLLVQWLKPIEQGLNVKFTAGIHTGCIQILVPVDSNIASVNDFKGKTIGVPALGGGPMVTVARLLEQAGYDSQNDVTWKVYPNAELPLALEKGEVDIISVADPFAQIQVEDGKAKSIFDTAKSDPFKDEYCCLVVVNGNLIDKDPATAAALTRAILKGAEWVNSNQEAVAKLEVDKQYVPGDVAVNTKVLSTYNYQPSVEGGLKALQQGAKEMKDIGVLEADTDVDELVNIAFAKLDGLK